MKNVHITCDTYEYNKRGSKPMLVYWILHKQYFIFLNTEHAIWLGLVSTIWLRWYAYVTGQVKKTLIAKLLIVIFQYRLTTMRSSESSRVSIPSHRIKFRIGFKEERKEKKRKGGLGVRGFLGRQHVCNHQ